MEKDLKKLRRELQGLIGSHLSYFPSITSTMDIALRAAEVGAPEGAVVVTTDQTGGRGRKGRVWSSSPGDDLAVSIVLHPAASVAEQLFMLCALGVADCLAAVMGTKAQFKWPNDVLVSSRKIAGILIESVQSKRGFASVVGIGLNVNMPGSHPAARRHKATSMSIISDTTFELPAVLSQLLQSLDRRYKQAVEGASLVSEWEKALVDIGRPVRTLAADGRQFSGVVQGVSANGQLAVRNSHGETVLVSADDTVLLDT